MTGHSLVRTIYLYLFALIGLALLVTGGVRLVDMGLKMFVFTQAEQEQRLLYQRPQLPPVGLEKVADVEDENVEPKEEVVLTPKEKEQVDRWIADYQDWQEQRSKVDPVDASRQRNASSSLAMILIGLPLYLFHWRLIKRDVQKGKKE